MKSAMLKPVVIAILSTGLLCANAYATVYHTTPTATETNTTTTTTTTGTQNQMQTTSTTDAKATGEAFLAANKSKPGVITLPDGLQYKVIVEGKGVKPTDSDVVTVHYAGTLVNDKEFDSSYTRGEPISFPVNGVIPGWVEALKLMKEGSTWELYIPASLAYGERGAPPAIGPNETLIFKVELIKVNKS